MLLQFASSKGVFIATQLNSTQRRVEFCRYRRVTQLNSTQLTQLNSVQPISAKQVIRVFVYDLMTYKLSRVEMS